MKSIIDCNNNLSQEYFTLRICQKKAMKLDKNWCCNLSIYNLPACTSFALAALLSSSSSSVHSGINLVNAEKLLDLLLGQEKVRDWGFAGHYRTPKARYLLNALEVVMKRITKPFSCPGHFSGPFDLLGLESLLPATSNVFNFLLRYPINRYNFSSHVIFEYLNN